MSSDAMAREPLALNLRLLHVLGLWPGGEGPWSSAGKYLVASALASALVGAFFISVWAAALVSDGDLGQLSDVLSVGLTNLSNGFKLAPFWLMRARLVRVVRVLREELYATGARPSTPATEAIVRRSAASIRLLTAVYVTWYVATCASWLLTSLVIADSAATGNSSTMVRTLPYPGWFPYDQKRSPAYEWSYVFQALAAMLDTVDAAVMDCFYIALVIHTRTQFQLLAVALRSIRLDAADMNLRLNHCVRYHQMIYSFIDEVQSLLGPITLVECIVMSFILCTISYQATIVPLSSLKFLTMVGFLGCEGSRLFLYCWAGTELRAQSAAIHAAAYDTDWYGADGRFKRTLSILMVRALRPSELRAHHFTAMTLDLFTTLLRASYSYYAVLRQIDNQELVPT